tara:strand:- start:1361 stop:2533 length:1173 start_codon:yes stop_codon:yes gene_type:complete
MTKEEIAKQFEAIKKQRGHANKPAPKLVFTDPLYHKARVLEGAGMVSADKPLPSASLVEKAKMHAKKLTGKMPSKKSIGAVAAGLATGYLGAKAIKKEAQAVSGRILMEHNDIQKEAFMGAAKSMAQAAMKKMDKGVRAVGKKVGKGGKAMANKASKGSMAGKMDMRTKKMQRLVGGGTVAAGAMGAGSMMGEEKKASQQAAGVGAAIAGPIGAAVGADKGKRFQSAGGSFLGGTLGSISGLGIAKALKMKNPMAAMSTVVGTGAAGHYMGATKAHGKDEKKKMKKKAETIFSKLGGYTEHGTMREKARAMAHMNLAQDLEEADKKNPGVAALKGTHVQPIMAKLIARKQAYKADQKGMGNLKTHVPFVGMGEAGEKALEKLKNEKKKKK